VTERIVAMFGNIALVVRVARDTRDTKLRTLIKAYLVFNRGKKVTAKEISEWINSNNFCLNRSIVNSRIISRLIYAGKYNPSHILYDIEDETVNNLKYYWVI